MRSSGCPQHLLATGLQEEHPATKNSAPITLKILYAFCLHSTTIPSPVLTGYGGKQLSWVHLERWPLSQCVWFVNGDGRD